MTYLRLLKRLSSNKQVHNFGFLFSIQASNILISVVTIPLVVGAIGVEQLGLVDLSLSIVYTLNIVVSYGYNLSAPREIAINSADKEELSRIFSKVLFSKMLITLCLGLLIFVMVQSLGLFNRNGTILLFSFSVLLSEVLLPHWLAQGLEKMQLLSLGNLLSKLLYLVFLIAWVNNPSDSLLVNFLLGASGVLVNFSLILYVIKYWGISLRWVKLADIWLSLTNNFYLFLSSLASYIAINSGIMILSFFATDYMLGAYSLADRVIRVLRIVPSIIIQAIYPKASRLFATDKEAFYLFLRNAYGLALAICLGISLFAFVFAPPIVGFLAHSHLAQSVEVLRILAFVPFFACLNIANMILVLVSDHKKTLVKSTWITFVLMMIVCISLSYSHGPAGLAVGLTFTEIITFGVQLYFNRLILPEETQRFYAVSISSRHSH
jgi:O-antigen/teichoic acid export membrane protein